MMSKWWMGFFLNFVIVQQVFAAQGAVDGGGGKGVVCRDEAGSITKAQLLDLYEGEVQYGYEMALSEDSLEAQVEQARERLERGRIDFNPIELKGLIDYILSSKRVLPDDVKLKVVEDSAHVILPRDCELEQLAYRTAENQILIDGEIWRALHPTHQAALVLHEATYWLYALFNEKNSIRVRRAVAAAFGGVDFEPVMPSPEEAGSEMLYCWTTDLTSENDGILTSTYAQFWVFDQRVDGERQLVLQFDFLGVPLLSKTILTVSGLSFEEFLQPSKRRSLGTVLQSSLTSGSVLLTITTERTGEADDIYGYINYQRVGGGMRAFQCRPADIGAGNEYPF